MTDPNCLKCDVELTEENRYVTKTKKYNQCLNCRRKYAREYQRKKRDKIVDESKLSENCFKCKIVFTEVIRWKDNQCVNCYREYQREYQRKRRAINKSVDLSTRNSHCFKCEADLSEVKRYGTQNQCLDCYHKMSQKNKEKINLKFNERYATDESFKKYRNYKAALRNILAGIQKSSKHVPFTKIKLDKWLKFCCINLNFDDFQKDLVPDHVLPLDIGLKDDSKWDMVSGWWNISPLTSEQNLVKNKHVDIEQISEHHKCLLKYLKENPKITPPTEYLDLLLEKDFEKLNIN